MSEIVSSSQNGTCHNITGLFNDIIRYLDEEKQLP